jgi:pimeloyl-ACP methyl ester carboxylesterase
VTTRSFQPNAWVPQRPPALVIAGAKDHSELPHAVATVEAVPSAEPAVVPGVGHAVPRDAPDVVVETIDRFLMGRWPP